MTNDVVHSQDELAVFRQEIQQFLKSHLSAELSARVRAGYYLSKEELANWNLALSKQGWTGFNWPREYGGPGWSPMQRYIFEEESAKAGAPILITIGLNQVAALLMAYGTPAQKKQHLSGIQDGSDIWCQGFSEPQAGSDLASMKCQAQLEGDHYVINGTKTWTTAAHWSSWCLLLARTDSSGKKQEGLTLLLLDMKTPGITIRPIIGIDGIHSLNQLFLDNVKIPVHQRVGEEGKGWGLMKVFLGHERISAAGIWRCRAHFDRLCHIARHQMRGSRPLLEHPVFKAKLAMIEIRMRALEIILLGIMNDPSRATDIEASHLKLRGTQTQQELLRMISEAAGEYALPFHQTSISKGWGEQTPIGPDFAATSTPAYFFWRKATISGGSSEVMRNLIAQKLLS
ncbi:MAG: acyl-CoA dehydrogenase family protein [Burkholderiaceae bacterium]